MFIYSSPLAKIQNIKSVKDVLVILKAQGFYDLPEIINDDFTPDINELANSIYFFIQRSSPNIEALIGEVLILTPKTASRQKIRAIYDELIKLILQTVTDEEVNDLHDLNFKRNFYTLVSYFEVILDCQK